MTSARCGRGLSLETTAATRNPSRRAHVSHSLPELCRRRRLSFKKLLSSSAPASEQDQRRPGPDCVALSALRRSEGEETVPPPRLVDGDKENEIPATCTLRFRFHVGAEGVEPRRERAWHLSMHLFRCDHIVPTNKTADQIKSTKNIN